MVVNLVSKLSKFKGVAHNERKEFMHQVGHKVVSKKDAFKLLVNNITIFFKLSTHFLLQSARHDKSTVQICHVKCPDAAIKAT